MTLNNSDTWIKIKTVNMCWLHPPMVVKYPIRLRRFDTSLILATATLPDQVIPENQV